MALSCTVRVVAVGCSEVPNSMDAMRHEFFCRTVLPQKKSACLSLEHVAVHICDIRCALADNTRIKIMDGKPGVRLKNVAHDQLVDAAMDATSLHFFLKVLLVCIEFFPR
jgi:hypothetical protein